MPHAFQSTPSLDASPGAVLDLEGLSELLGTLRERGYDLIGPTVRDAAVVLDEIRTVDDLPVGWTDEQVGGIYRLQRREDAEHFYLPEGRKPARLDSRPMTVSIAAARVRSNNPTNAASVSPSGRTND